MWSTRGEAQVECLIILAIAIIIALIVFGVVKGFTEMKPGGPISLAKERIEWQSKEVVLTASTLYANGTGVLLLANKANYPIRVIKIGIGVPEALYANSPEIPVTGSAKLSISKEYFLQGELGKEYSLDVVIVYAHAREPDIIASVKGKISGAYQ